jgi:hypothetical protein
MPFVIKVNTSQYDDEKYFEYLSIRKKHGSTFTYLHENPKHDNIIIFDSEEDAKNYMYISDFLDEDRAEIEFQPEEPADKNQLNLF